VVTEEFGSQLIFFVFELDGHEGAAGLLGFPALFLNLEDDLRLRGSSDSLQALLNKLVLRRTGTDEGLSRRDVTNDVDPLWQLAGLSTGELAERGLSHPQGCEVDFAHCN
jgi:hypothetical protein